MALRNNSRPVLPGERTDTNGQVVRNTILLSIPDNEYSIVRPDLEFIALPDRHSLHEPNRALKYAYFLNRGMISLVVVTRSGKTVEIGVVGNEGFCPAPMLVDLKRSPHRAIVQIAGDGFRMTAAALKKASWACPEFQRILTRYVVMQSMQVGQTGACNRLHDLEQRLARWLLLTQDRVKSRMLSITHDFLATMLGTDRPSVSLAAGTLQRKKMIEYTYGGVQILNRKKLETAACECYGIIRQFDGLLGFE